MGWRFYAQRATTGLWLDTNVELSDPSLAWTKSGPMVGQAKIPAGLEANLIAPDGRATWGRMDTLLLGEENGKLSWFGVCVSANPSKEGLQLMFIGFSGWLQGIPFLENYKVWRTNAFDIARHIINHSHQYDDRIQIETSGNKSSFVVGDQEPPAQPAKPGRKKNESKSEYLNSARYKKWQDAMADWTDKYGDRTPFELTKWEAPFCGEELDQLAKEVGFEYIEAVRWKDRAALKYECKIELTDDLVRRRTDIKFQDGVNLAQPLDPKDNNDAFANRVIGMGAGEGADVVMTGPQGSPDGRLYQAAYVSYKTVKDKNRLAELARADQKVLSTKTPKIGQVVVWDQPGSGFASIGTLRPGDEVLVESRNIEPPVSSWSEIQTIQRNPYSNFATLTLERAK